MRIASGSDAKRSAIDNPDAISPTLIVLTLLLVSAIVFPLTHLIPEDMVVLRCEAKAYAEDLETLRYLW